jgi:hypothetical protein
MLRETSHDVSKLDQYVLANDTLLVADQRAAYSAIYQIEIKGKRIESFTRCLLRWNRKDSCH